MLPEEVKEVAVRIGQFYLKKNHGDYCAAEKEIHSLHISDLAVSNVVTAKTARTTTVTITTGRPGLLIGRRGMNIDELSKHLNMEVRIVEDVDPLINYLIPYRNEE